MSTLNIAVGNKVKFYLSHKIQNELGARLGPILDDFVGKWFTGEVLTKHLVESANLWVYSILPDDIGLCAKVRFLRGKDIISYWDRDIKSGELQLLP
jgi:hypothetical protein